MSEISAVQGSLDLLATHPPELLLMLNSYCAITKIEFFENHYQRLKKMIYLNLDMLTDLGL